MQSKVLHGRLARGDLLIMSSDVGPEHKPKVDNNIQLNTECESAGQQDLAFDKLLAGGKVIMPLEDQF